MTASGLLTAPAALAAWATPSRKLEQHANQAGTTWFGSWSVHGTVIKNGGTFSVHSLRADWIVNFTSQLIPRNEADLQPPIYPIKPIIAGLRYRHTINCTSWRNRPGTHRTRGVSKLETQGVKRLFREAEWTPLEPADGFSGSSRPSFADETYPPSDPRFRCTEVEHRIDVVYRSRRETSFARIAVGRERFK